MFNHQPFIFLGSILQSTFFFHKKPVCKKLDLRAQTPKILINLRSAIRNPKKLFIVKTPETIEIECKINVEIDILSQIISS